MNKTEFLNILEESLKGEVSQNIIDQNIKYYDQYISKASSEEEAQVLEELGDPRLIARTIIEAERMSKQRNQRSYTYNESSYYNQDRMYEDLPPKRKGIFTSNLKWYHKLAMILLLLIIFSILIFIGRIVFRLFFFIGFPVILILLLLILFRKR
jgi:hypothetical protein